MHDTLIEDQLRNVLRDEARSLPFELTVGTLERRLVERRLGRTRRRWLMAAAVGVLALTGAAAILVGVRGDQPPVATTPSPSTTPRPTLPEPAALLASFPDATVAFEHAVGPAGGPAERDPSPPPDATPPAPVEFGRVRFEGPFVIGVACIGDGEIVVEISTPSLGIPYTQAHGPCDGTPIHSEYLAPPIDPASQGDAVTVRVDRGASWRLAIGVYPTDLSTPPTFAPIEITDGWHVVSDGGAQLLTMESPRTGARVNVPTEATAIAVLLQCQGDGPVTITSAGALPTEVACDPSGSTHRIELPAVGGEPLTLGATVDGGGRTWVRLIVEANAAIVDTYPPAPPMPPDLALTPYAAPDQNVVGLGTLGSRRQTIVELQGATTGRPAGDRLPVSVSSQIDGSRLDLLAIPSGDVIRTVATVPAPSFIFDSWIDPSHEQVFFAVAREVNVEFHRVSTDGSEDTVLATIPRDGTTGFTAALAGDDGVFVIDWCVANACTRVLVDGPTGAVRTAERSGDAVCRIVGIAAGTIIGTSRDLCSEESATTLIAVPVVGGRPTVLASDATGGLRGGVVVATRAGLQVVIDTAFDEQGPVVGIIDVTTGTVTPLMIEVDDGGTLTPTRLPMPAGWVLMSSGMFGDFPWQRSLDRPVPVAVNLDTGERIELVNLPHWRSELP